MEVVGRNDVITSVHKHKQLNTPGNHTYGTDVYVQIGVLLRGWG